MRELTAQELDRVSGGADGEQDIKVIGERPNNFNLVAQYLDDDLQPPLETFYGGGGDDAPAEDEQAPPCPNGTSSGNEAMPSGDIAKIRELAATLKAKIGSAYIEFGLIIYENGGDYFLSGSQTKYKAGMNALAPSEMGIPEGSKIVAIAHNHPHGDPRPSSEQDYPGQDHDWSGMQTLISSDFSYWGIEVDPNALMYIVTQDGVYEYTQDDKGTRNLADANKIDEGGC